MYMANPEALFDYEPTLRENIDAFYSWQDMRINFFSRLTNQIYVKEQVMAAEGDVDRAKAQFKKDESDKAKEDRSKLIKSILIEYDAISSAVDQKKSTRAKDKYLKENGVYLKSIATYRTVRGCVVAQIQEQEQSKVIKYMVEQHPLWDRYLKHVKGCGHISAGFLISHLDVHKARHPSSFWKYSGLDVVLNQESGKWEGRSQRKAHCIIRKYISREGTEESKLSITYNKDVKSKLLFVVGRGLIMSNGPYRKIYDDYRHRLDLRPDLESSSKLHKFNMARRYVVKIFLKDLWVAWRELEGYEWEEDYYTKFIAGRGHGQNTSPSVNGQPPVRTKEQMTSSCCYILDTGLNPDWYGYEEFANQQTV